MRSFGLMLLLATTTAGGCSYLKNRANDALDVFRFQANWGPGLYAGARATDFLATGLGMRHQEYVGMYGRYGSHAESEVTDVGFGVAILGSTMWYGSDPLLADDSSVLGFDQDVVSSQLLFFVPARGIHCGTGYSLSGRGLNVADVDASLAVIWVGTDVGFSPGQFVDLVLGFVGIDVGSDDVFGGGSIDDAANATDPTKDT